MQCIYCTYGHGQFSGCRVEHKHNTTGLVNIRQTHQNSESCLELQSSLTPSLVAGSWSNPSMPDVDERLCCYFDENGKQCSCRMFTAPANKNARYHCRECTHGFSNHPEAQFSNKSPKLTMDVKVEPATGNRLLDVFHQRKTSRTMELPNSLQHVREEQDVLVGTWLLLINALDECVHTGANAAKFAFRRDWTHDDVDKYLREHVFPRPMEYALMHKKGKSKASCCWKLAFKEKQRFGLAVTEDLPTGQDLFYYRGRFKCGTDSSIIIGMSYAFHLLNY
ncbi:hypothetical protein F5J12DRAFT_731104 [Pisolithus orientalis]|uniref:uncharacterized protein n=1 Tax=Pisolithus orientalis TaxID=936130 RepID=UPI0022259B8F|nr:uncharacterized protein F5J12DRAFT_732191 [Pisolithus orientalis]XP_051594041.1 uncharacterized protein F5J12DRAFT_731104 [Pisolithus orientalis]KAI5980758.1 hypothetical protein F5J12DRAFT_732191 [Pisolithus orientalis]KAI5981898.1 hypothetical protein F5J12DRAFT_731104 [Pisolithus orientalis]